MMLDHWRGRMRLLIGIGVAVFAVSVAGGVAAQDLEHTKAAERLVTGFLNLSQPRQSFAQTILDYCKDTATHLPRNSQEEAAWLERELASNDIKRRERAVETVQYDRHYLQQMLGECVQVSKSIVERRY